MSYSMGEAAKATGKSKTTIHRAIKNGTISASRNEDGSYTIDPAELHRVFPPVTRNSDEGVTVEQYVTHKEHPVTPREIEYLRELLDEKTARIQELQDDRDHWRDEAFYLRKLLPAPSAVTPVATAEAERPQEPPTEKPKRKSFWQWLTEK